MFFEAMKKKMEMPLIPTVRRRSKRLIEKHQRVVDGMDKTLKLPKQRKKRNIIHLYNGIHLGDTIII
jgi:hypothetical protein